ncbi:hypothetical protein SAY86_014778 [Trapa natans]|uniref:SBP-type domain-containing protein n=1 Tax=Trapa natans TaxID=22666 RepID=A0AAN7QGA8_TRANT|nr:hypothetical protein SAY86_014778 [Trapa natans]
MELGSISRTDPASSPPPTASSSPLHHGLKIGRKIYFEQDHAAAPLANPPPSMSGPPSSSKKGVRAAGTGGGAVQGALPPRCQVEGCKVDLSDAKAYYSRHKVCTMHSKSPRVIVGAIEQRFCQQCSRFHLLGEFDQIKRSCRRRLAGHNERRRKPPPGSLLASRYGRLSASVFENRSRSGSFMMDFTAYPRHIARNAWSSPLSTDGGPSNQMADHGKPSVHHHPWQCGTENPPMPSLFLQGSASNGRSSYTSHGIPPGGCYTGTNPDSICALSLLSNQPWSSSRSQAPALSMIEMLTHQEPTTAAPHGASMNHFTNASGGFKVSHDTLVTPSELGLTQISQHLDDHYSGELEPSQQRRRQYMQLDPQQMHWSL